jgi:hypothetical protein
MTEREIQRYGEIQYLKGRLDELYKSFPDVTELHASRLADARIQKYMDKLKNLDEISYHLYLVELHTRKVSKDRSKKHIKSLLQDVVTNVDDQELRDRILRQIELY